AILPNPQIVNAGFAKADLNNEPIKNALDRVPREYFIPEKYREQLDKGKQLDPAQSSDISQPSVIALMSEQARIQQGSRVLEIGTGTGYQAAVLSELGAEVFTIEIVPELSEQARRTLFSLGYENVRLRVGDGAKGWQEHAPFDAIIVTAASPVVPRDLLKQLAPQGRMIFPLEEEGKDYEQLLLITRDGSSLTTSRLGKVHFEPLSGMIRDAQQKTVNYSEPKLLQEAIRSGKNDESIAR
ncbi:UNVERIFIED_CONTAM: hypothetical protein GTU68_015671, partial [Idotea baltica]|nr:hypothetical protein [Idotea baltica]